MATVEKRPVGRPKQPNSARITVINLKGSPELRAWLVAAAAKTHLPAVTIARLALAEWARKNKIRKPPER